MNQILLILLFLLFGTLIALFFISRKSQQVMNSLLTIMTHPERVKVKDASRILQMLLNDEMKKINDNFKTISDSLKEQIKHAEQIKKELTEQNDKMIETADEATKKISNMSQRLDNTIDGLQNIVSSNGWQDVQNITDNFAGNIDTLLNKIVDVSTTTTENAGKINEQITACTESEQKIAEQLQNSFKSNAENIETINKNATELKETLTNLQTNVADGFTKIKTESTDYDETMKNNDKLLNDYLTKLAEFGKQSGKELKNQTNSLTQTANVVASAIRLAEYSIDKQSRKLETTIEALNNSTATTQTSVRNVATEITDLMNTYNKGIQDFSQSVVKEIGDVSTVANGTLEKTKTAANEFSNSVKVMGTGVRETLIEMNKAHTQLSGQSENLIKMSTQTTEQLKPLSELIEKYYKALPDLAANSKDMGDNLEQIVNTLVEKTELLKTTIKDSLKNMDKSSAELGNLAGESRQQMIDLMADYAKAVEAMQSLNKQMMVARASAPMEAIKVNPTQTFKPVNTKDFLNQVDKTFDKMYEQAVDLTRSIGSDIPDVIWKKYNGGDKKIFAKWLLKVLAATDKKQIRNLVKSDAVFRSQATPFIRNFELILSGADQTNDGEKLKTALLKTDLGMIYTTISTSM